MLCFILSYKAKVSFFSLKKLGILSYKLVNLSHLDLCDCFRMVSFILFSTPCISCKLEVKAKDIRFSANIFWHEYFVGIVHIIKLYVFVYPTVSVTNTHLTGLRW